jgi:hypothetical protein
VQLITFPKRYFSSNSIQRYLRLSAAKRVKLIKIHPEKKNYWFYSISLVSWHKMEDISGLRGWDFDEWYLFGNVMSCTFYDKNFITKFYEFRCQIWLQIWNLLKIGRVHQEFSNNSKVSSYLLGYILLFWKVMMKAFQ